MQFSPPPLPLYSQKILVLPDSYDKLPVLAEKITGNFLGRIREFNQPNREYIIMQHL